MTESEMQDIAKSAYVLCQQLISIEASMKDVTAVCAYSSYARHYNNILGEAQIILAHDKTIYKSVAFLSRYSELDDDDSGISFEKIKADIPILKAAVLSFFEFYFPKSEKERIGFYGSQQETE